MQGLSLLSTIPSLFYIFRTRKYNANLTNSLPGYTQEGNQALNKKLIFYLSFGTILAVNSQVYSYMNDLPRMFKEMGNMEKAAFDDGGVVEVQL